MAVVSVEYAQELLRGEAPVTVQCSMVSQVRAADWMHARLRSQRAPTFFQTIAGEFQSLLPAGLRVAGAFLGSGPTPREAADACGGEFIVARKGDDGEVRFLVVRQGSESPIQAEVMTEPVPGVALLRSSTRLVQTVGFQDADRGPTVGDIAAAFLDAEGTLNREDLGFIAESSSSGSGSTVPRQLLWAASSSPLLSSSAAEESALDYKPQPSFVNCVPVRETTTSGSCVAPVFEYHPVTGRPYVSELALNLDVLCYLPSDTSAADTLQKHLRPALLRQLRQMQHALLQQAQQPQQRQQLAPVAAHHFKPPGFSHYITVCYPQLSTDAEATEAKLLPHRRRLHQLMGLPEDRPALRLAQAIEFGSLLEERAAAKDASCASPGQVQVRLRDVHALLAVPGIGGTTHLVDGSYEYYHYLQVT